MLSLLTLRVQSSRYIQQTIPAMDMQINENCSPDDSFKTDSSEAGYREKRYLRVFFEVHVVPRDPDGEKITPITLERHDSLGPELNTSDSVRLKRMNFIQYEAAYHDLLRQATDLKSQLVKKYKGKNYSVYIISKNFKN